MRFVHTLVVCTTCLVPALGHAAAIQSDVSVNFDTAAELQSTVDQFRDDLGANNGNAPVNGDPNGRRQIDWDGAPDAISDPNPFPGDFFNFNAFPRARGIEFQETGDTTGFELSATEASGTPPVFGQPNDFVPFSPERLFTPVGGNTFDVHFFDPADQITPALSRGLGVVFSDVEEANITSMTFYDIDNNVLAKRYAKTGKNQSLSFLGVIFDEAVIASVSFEVGSSIFDGDGFLDPGDKVVMDDFIFGEPVPIDLAPVPLPAGAVLLLTGLAALGWRRKAQKA